MTAIALMYALAVGQTADVSREVERFLEILRAEDAESCGVMAAAKIQEGYYPQAIYYLKAGHAFDPSDTRLVRGLALARAEVNYGEGNRLQLQPETEWYPGSLFAPFIFVTGFLAFALMCAAFTRWLMIRQKCWLLIAACLAPVAEIPASNELVRWSRSVRDADATPMVVVHDVDLRSGNALEYPVRIPIPKGAECRRINHRGEWVQVEFASGLAGWLQNNVLMMTREVNPPDPTPF